MIEQHMVWSSTWLQWEHGIGEYHSQNTTAFFGAQCEAPRVETTTVLPKVS